MPKFEKEVAEISWWIEKALSASKDQDVKCVRKLHLKEKEIAYYDVGKVFRFKKIISALHIKTESTKEYDECSNVVFYIDAIKAKGVREFIQIDDN